LNFWSKATRKSIVSVADEESDIPSSARNSSIHVEQLTLNQRVQGSSPCAPTTKSMTCLIPQKGRQLVSTLCPQNPDINPAVDSKIAEHALASGQWILTTREAHVPPGVEKVYDRHHYLPEKRDAFDK
jgi:hypothetical protein